MKQSSSLFSAILSVAALFFCFSSVKSLPIKKRSSSGEEKYVTAHQMVGNSYSYTQDTWLQQMTLANSSGIDALALNMGSDSWQPARIADAYAAAEQLGYKVYLSFDMSVLPCSTAGDATNLVNMVLQYDQHPAQFKYPPSQPLSVVTTFAGESCNFGQSNPQQGWLNEFKNKLNGKIHFLPTFFVAPNELSSTYANVIDGYLAWNAGFTNTVTTSTFSQLINSIGQTLSDLLSPLQNSPAKSAMEGLFSSISGDMQYINALGGKTYHTTVSGWFSTHYDSDEFGGKNFIYLSENILPERFETIVKNRDLMDLVQIQTWNDYGESTYVGPVLQDQPDSQGWTDGCDHTPWQIIIKYFAEAYKTGEYPEIEQDQVIVWARTALKDASAPDPVPQPENYQLAQDNMYVFVLATESSTVELSTAANPADGVQTFNAPAGYSTFSIPLTANGGMSAQIKRDGQIITSVHPTNYTTKTNPEIYNFNAAVYTSST